MEISKQPIPITRHKRPGTKMEPQWLTIHSTGNPASTAQNERDNLARVSNTRQASFHLVVDERQAILCIPLDEVAYHAGSIEGNTRSIGLEICEGGNRQKTLANAAELAAQILLDRGWGIERMVQHHHWSGKDCPRILRQGNLWQEWVAQVKANMEGGSEEVKRYNTLEEVPGWARPLIARLIDKGYLSGGTDGKGLDLTDDMIRLLAINDRAGVYR